MYNQEYDQICFVLYFSDEFSDIYIQQKKN